MDRYDIAIIGTGPAGISAAITSKIRNKKILFIGDKNLTKKLSSAHEINNYPGFPKVSGKDLAEAFAGHLKQMEIEITDVKVNAVYAMGDYFALQTSGGDFEASSVIIATGVMQGKMYEGEEGLVGNGVSYCATCDGNLYKGKKVAVAGYSKKEEEEVRFLSGVAESVIYFPVYKEKDFTFPDNVEIREEVPTAVKRDKAVVTVTTNKGNYEVDGFFVLRDSVSPGQLVPGLETEGAHIKVDRSMKTSIKGLFACGDITGKPYQYVKSAGEGNVAALSAAAWLDEMITGSKA